MTKIKNKNKQVTSKRSRIWIRTGSSQEHYQEQYHEKEPNQKHEQEEWLLSITK